MATLQDEEGLNFSTQYKIVDPLAVRPVVLIGAGSVGSHVAMNLAKRGVRQLTVYDPKAVRSENIPASEYRQIDLARPKVHALADLIRDAACLEIDTRDKSYGGEPLSGTVISCVDTMEARMLIWERVRAHKALVDLYVDTRVVGQFIQVFAIVPGDPDDVPFYEYYLRYSSKEAEPNMCGRHGTKSISAKTASVVDSNLTQFWQNARKKRIHEEQVVDLELIT
jgi:molybdopterin/thiamine biosynthesis adenylyltransferase